MLRGATAEDSLAMGKVYCEAWKAAYRGMMPDAFLDSLTDENCAPPPERISPDNTIVWEADGVVCGLANFGPGRDADSGDMAEIRSIYVLPACWQSGIGRKLIEGAADALRRLGYTRVSCGPLRQTPVQGDFMRNRAWCRRAAARSRSRAKSSANAATKRISEHKKAARKSCFFYMYIS